MDLEDSESEEIVEVQAKNKSSKNARLHGHGFSNRLLWILTVILNRIRNDSNTNNPFFLRWVSQAQRFY